MGRLRLLVVHAAIAFIVLGHLRSLVTDSEDWPFSRYPMYSYPPPKELVAYRIAAVVGGGSAAEPEREVLLMDRRSFRPMTHLAVGSTLSRLDQRLDREAALDEALLQLAARYEAGRRAGKHDGEPLRRLRLYKLVWSVLPDAANSGTPDRRDLVREVTVDD
jgi:hypothetical protein